MNKESMLKFANVALKAGVNIQKDQILIISAPVHCADVVHVIAEQAYELGAKRVVVDYRDDELTKLRYNGESLETLTTFYDYEIESKNVWINENACRIAIVSEDPEIFTSCDQTKMAERSKAYSDKIKPFMDCQMSNGMRWCVVAYPEKAWAKKIFPNCQEQEGMEKLWNLIQKAMRLDCDDPVEAWSEFARKSQVRCDVLNNSGIVKYHYTNSLGTDLYVEMMPESIWLSAEEKAKDGHKFFANLPTEEVFSAPKKDGINGVLYSALPLVYNGNVIDKFKFVFENGKIKEYFAEVGMQTLKSIIETDEGSNYLGEIAMVQYDSPISNMKTLFYNTLFDENASCHFAIGKGYPTCVSGSDGKTIDELVAMGLNDSLVHEDFMVGTKDLNIVGIKEDGSQIQIMKEGNFVI